MSRSKQELVFYSGFSNNAVFILDGLKSSDSQTARHLHEELADLSYSIQTPYCSYLGTPSRGEFFSALEAIQADCKEGVRPIIHIEAHGQKDAGIVLGDQEEKVTWEELIQQLRAINVVTGNNLGVVMAACFGLYAISPVKIFEPSPFYFLIGSDEKVPAGELDDIMKRFYRLLFETHSLFSAMGQVEERFKAFHAEKFFCIAFGRYIKQACTGKGRAARIERLITRAIERGMLSNRDNLRRARQVAKRLTKPSRDAFDNLARIFLHGRYVLTYEQLRDFVIRKST